MTDTPFDRLTDAISGERRAWHRVEVSPDDIHALLTATASQDRLDGGDPFCRHCGCLAQGLPCCYCEEPR